MRNMQNMKIMSIIKKMKIIKIKKTKFSVFNVLTIFMLPIVGLLSGCESMNSSFDCQSKPGVLCKNLDQVNKMVNQGTLGGADSLTEDASSSCKNCTLSPDGKSEIKNTGDFTTPYPKISANSMNPGDPVRYGEKVMRVWLAPYEDKDGNYYQPTTLYTVVKPGHWIGAPVAAINDEGDKS